MVLLTQGLDFIKVPRETVEKGAGLPGDTDKPLRGRILENLIGSA